MDNLIFDPGFYTKVRIDQHGNILGADQITKSDLPNHTHDLKEITGDFKDKVVEVLSTFFANNADSSVEFSFDPVTSTVTADIRLDGTTVSKNKYGELTSKNAGEIIEIPTQPTPSITIEDVRKEVYEVLSTAFANNDVVTFDWNTKAHTFETDIKIDGVTISKNIDGELYASGSGVPTDSLGCATHNHTSTQITDFEEAVKLLLEKYHNQSIDIAILRNFIDNSTIVINSYGQLSSVSTVIGKHTHELKDIVDYEPPESAAKQPMTGLGPNAVYDTGVIDFSKLNIGYSILALSQYLNEVVNKRMTALNDKILQLSSEGNNAGGVFFTPHRLSIKNILYDTVNNCYREVYYANQLYLTLDFLAKNTGKITLYVNGVAKGSADIAALKATGYSSGIFSVEESYYKNFTLVQVLKIDVREFVQQEGYYQFKLKYSTDVAEDNSTTVAIYATPYESLPYEVADITPTHKILTTKYYDPIQYYTYKVTIPDYEKYRFINNLAGFTKGVITGVIHVPTILTLPNLFTATTLPLEFPHEQEQSTSILYTYISSMNQCGVVNDVVTPAINGQYYQITFDIPCTEMCNAMQLWGFPDGCSIYKHQDDWARDNNNAIYPHVSGIIKNNAPYKLLWLSGYDSGRQIIHLKVESRKPLDLKSVQIKPCIIHNTTRTL